MLEVLSKCFGLKLKQCFKYLTSLVPWSGFTLNINSSLTLEFQCPNQIAELLNVITTLVIQSLIKWWMTLSQSLVGIWDTNLERRTERVCEILCGRERCFCDVADWLWQKFMLFLLVPACHF